MQAEIEKKAVAVAERIQQDILDANYLPGMVIGSEPQLCARYGVGRTALREATHLLQFRGLTRMRRGPSGGLVVDQPGEAAVVRGLASLICGGRVDEILEEARTTLTRVSTTLLPCANTAVIPLAELASRTDNTALKGIVAIFEGLCHLNLHDTVPGPDPVAQDSPRPLQQQSAPQRAQLFGTSRAAQIARQLYARIQLNGSQTLQRLGSESDLCVRFAVGVPVARQVVRLLEESGVLTSQRGRGRGLYLRKPTPDQFRHSIASYLVGCRAPSVDCWTLNEALEAQVAAIDGAFGPRAPNPLLIALMEGLRTYLRLRARERRVPIGHHVSFGPSPAVTAIRAVTAAMASREHLHGHAVLIR